MTKITDTVVQAYDNFYKESDVEWRMIGAKAKAQNLIEVCKNKDFKKILEVGAGDGSVLHYLNKWGFGMELYALEIAQSGVDLIKTRNLERLKEVQAFDGYHIPYSDDTFDLVVLTHVLEHVEHERQLLRELKRVARFIAIEVPLDYRFGVDQRMKHFLDYGHINMYSPTLIRFLLQSEGLKVLSDKVSLTAPEATKFNEFVNRKRPRSVFRILKIELEYRVKTLLSNLLGQKKKEQFGNAYTILTKNSTNKLQIF